MSVVENVQNKDIFYIILLKDGFVTVPKQWLTYDKKYTFWPSNVHTAQCINLIKSCAEVNEQWEKYEIKFIYGTAGVIRSKFKDVSEGDVSAPLKIWLSHAQDRIKNKRQE